jgi:Domain of unknown function (DUF4160)
VAKQRKSDKKSAKRIRAQRSSAITVSQAQFIALVLELQESLGGAEVDAEYQKLSKKYPNRRYRLLRKLPSVAVRMDAGKNHGRSHVHCDVGKQRRVASVALDNGEVLAGELKGLYLREVRAWLQKHKIVLGILWSEMRMGRSVDALICKIKEGGEFG